MANLIDKVVAQSKPINAKKSKESGKAKRIRTSFKHQQLRVMKAYFEISRNPDSKDLRQLSQKTGLSKRVLQVRRLKEILLFDYKRTFSDYLLMQVADRDFNGLSFSGIRLRM